jgi:hypothetical protein
MHKRLCLSTASFIVALLLLAPPASASSEAGWACTANDSEAGWTLLAAGGSFDPIPPVIPPEGLKVITGWGVWAGPGFGPLAQRLEVFEVQNEASDYKKIGESAMETVTEGHNSFQTRIPVTEGDSIGLYGPVETLFCDEEDGAISLLYEGAVATGETKPFEGASKVGTPLRVVVEDDRDGDGYGDQSQDGCPESALFHTSCPLPAISVGTVSVKKRAIWIEASNNTDASIEAIGEVRWSARPKPTATASTIARFVRVGLSSGPAVQIAAGTPVTLMVSLPKNLRKRLAALSPQHSLQARIDVKATNLVPYVGTHEIKVKLPGRKPASRR